VAGVCVSVSTRTMPQSKPRGAEAVWQASKVRATSGRVRGPWVIGEGTAVGEMGTGVGCAGAVGEGGARDGANVGTWTMGAGVDADPEVVSVSGRQPPSIRHPTIARRRPGLRIQLPPSP